MKLTIGQLRRLIREFGVDDTMRHEAGFFMDGGAHSSMRDKEASVINQPPGLGGPEDEEDKDEQEKPSQWTARVRRRGTLGST